MLLGLGLAGISDHSLNPLADGTKTAFRVFGDAAAPATTATFCFMRLRVVQP
jgi:hypothetical protein